LYKLFLTLRYLRTRRIAYFAIAAVTLCTMMVLIVMSVMGGFLEQIKLKARGLLGDIVIDNGTYRGFPLYQEFIDDISRWPEIEKATPVIYAYGILRLANTTRVNPVQIVGIRLQEVYVVNAFKRGLYYERHYPGTTDLGEQRQPVLGLSPNSPRAADPPGALLPVLPEPFRSALEKSRAAGVTDEDVSDTALNAILRENGLAPVPGVWALNPAIESEGVPPPGFVGDPYPGLIVGRDLVALRLPDGPYERSDGLYICPRRGAQALVTVVPIREDARLDTPTVTAFRFVDDSRTGIYEIDSKHVYCDFELLQQLMFMNEAPTADGTARRAARCAQIQIKVNPDAVNTNRPEEMKSLTARLQDHYRRLAGDSRFSLVFEDAALLSSIAVRTWQESQAQIIGPVEKERQLVTILFGIISLVAVALVLCILYMIVLQKTRDIGIIKSVGGSSAGVAFIFICYGAAVGVVGSILGSVLGTLFVTYINSIQEFLIWLNPAWRVWNREVYSFDEIPHEVAAIDVVVVSVLAIVTATLGSLAAAWRAGTMQPVEAIRHE
jgi:lipoprotein-releasing system permease protein